jgi:hypothetical protein
MYTDFVHYTADSGAEFGDVKSSTSRKAFPSSIDEYSHRQASEIEGNKSQETTH